MLVFQGVNMQHCLFVSPPAAAPGGLIKEEYIHDCIQMDLPPGMPLSDHQAAMKLPPPDHYGQPLVPPQLPSEPHGPPPVTRYTNLPISPKGQHFLSLNLTLKLVVEG